MSYTLSVVFLPRHALRLGWAIQSKQGFHRDSELSTRSLYARLYESHQVADAVLTGLHPSDTGDRCCGERSDLGRVFVRRKPLFAPVSEGSRRGW